MKINRKYIDKEILLENAEQCLKTPICHIVDAHSPMSKGGRHDYYSNGDYWWPNPDTADGLPYIRRDGESNPNMFSEHRMALRVMCEHVSTLATAYCLTKQTRYCERAIQWLTEFFIDNETKMNPHLNYAQAIPGICDGRGIGLIDTLHIIDIPYAITALKKCMDTDIYKALVQWFSDYLHWMMTSQHGIDERNQGNNHSVCYFVQASVFATFVNDKEVIDYCKNEYKHRLLPKQMREDGGFPRELERTKPYAYSIFVLDNLCTICHVLSTEEDNLWKYTVDGKNIQRGLDFLYPYLATKTDWPYAQDIEAFEEWPIQMSFMLFSGIALKDLRYLQLWERLNPYPESLEVKRNKGVKQAVLWI